MKKLAYLFAAVIMVAALGSCEQDDSEILLKKGGSGSPTAVIGSDAGITPVVIAGSNNGGNITCAEVAAHFQLEEGYFRCGEKIDYNDGKFDGEFPDGLMVEVTDGKYVAFEMEAPLLIDGVEYIVGAVIVKGSSAANVYYYPGGSMGDSGLSSPVNSSGKPAGLSNLTFCLQKANPLVIALKTYLANPVAGEVITYKRNGWAVSGGLGVSTEYGLHMGYNYYDFNGENEFELVRATLDAIVGPIGTIKATDYWENNIHYLEVVLDLDDESFVFDDTYLYVGSLEGYEGLWHVLFPFQAIDNIVGQRVFKIDMSTIL
ncbi:MAG: hypothetical protein WAV93_01050 [Bacteroidales bacterium]